MFVWGARFRRLKITGFCKESARSALISWLEVLKQAVCKEFSDFIMAVLTGLCH
jgi:hypothetical protein